MIDLTPCLLVNIADVYHVCDAYGDNINKGSK